MKKNGRYLEDNFDLEEFNNDYRKKLTANYWFRLLLRALIAAFVILAALLVFVAAKRYIEQRNKERISMQTREIVQEQEAAAVNEAPVYAASPAEPEPIQRPIPPSAPETEPEPAPKEIISSIAELRAAFSNDEIVGYLKIEGTNIDCAVVQAADNEFYLNHDIGKRESVAGSVFMDYENAPGELDKNTVIYGHNMRDGSMFHNMRYYASKAYFEAHPRVMLTTIYEETEWEIFSFYSTDTDFYYIQTGFDSAVEFLSLAYAMKEKSMYDTGVTVDVNDKILTLSTCTNLPDDTRYVLNAKLVSQPAK